LATPITPGTFKNLDTMKLKKEQLDNLGSELTLRYPPETPPGPPGPGDALYEFLYGPPIPGSGLFDTIGDQTTGFIKTALDQLSPLDEQKLSNCMNLSPLTTAVERIGTKLYEDIADKFNAINDYLFKGGHFDRIYEDLYNLWQIDNSSFIYAYIIGPGKTYIDNLNNVITNLETDLNSAKDAVINFTSRTIQNLVVNKITESFKDTVQLLGCIGSATPPDMYTYRAAELIENVEIVNLTMNDPPEAKKYIETAVRGRASSTESTIDTAFNNIKIL